MNNLAGESQSRERVNDIMEHLNPISQKAIIYCRVSSKKQKTQGSGLDSQEHRCRMHAQSKGYVVEAVFPDDVSGGGDFMDRPGMVCLLNYLASNPHTNYVVIFDDLKRFARDTLFHWKLRQELANYGASVDCLNFHFQDTPEGEFMETIAAAQSQLERKQNRRQTIQKMKARMEKGYWVFQAPVGYRYERVQGHGKLLIKNEPLASIVTEALEGYANGRFQIQVEVKRFLESQPAYPKDLPGDKIRSQRITDLLKQSIYAGYIQKADWQIKMVKGQHTAFVTLQTFQRIQDRLNEKARVPARKDINADFPLRGFVLCGGCEAPLRAGWTKGKSKHYPYYVCQTKTCESYGKSIRRADIEGDFETLLKTLIPSRELFHLACAAFKDAWDKKSEYIQQQAKIFKGQVQKIEKEIEQLVKRLVHTDNERVITAYEERLDSLETEKAVLSEKALKKPEPHYPFREGLEHALSFLSNPYRLWASRHIEQRRMVLKLAFVSSIIYDRERGYRTPKISLPFKMLGDFSAMKCGMVGPAGLEPATKRL